MTGLKRVATFGSAQGAVTAATMAHEGLSSKNGVPIALRVAKFVIRHPVMWPRPSQSAGARRGLVPSAVSHAEKRLTAEGRAAAFARLAPGVSVRSINS